MDEKLYVCKRCPPNKNRFTLSERWTNTEVCPGCLKWDELEDLEAKSSKPQTPFEEKSFDKTRASYNKYSTLTSYRLDAVLAEAYRMGYKDSLAERVEEKVIGKSEEKKKV